VTTGQHPEVVPTNGGFGPSALATPANALTITRLFVSPVLFAMLAREYVSWTATALWAVLALTDGLDGWVARRHGATRSGAFLDPLADKVLVLGAMAVLVGTGAFGWLPVVLIGARELGISLYRTYWGRRGLAIPARRSAKVKTVVQELAVTAVICPPLAAHFPWLGETLLWAAVVLTLVSGAQYVLDGRRAITTMGADVAPDVGS
jgi:CDP-diacylglycerol--glycerol-3-phosphate 3-phosphatidyltransferase